MRNDTNDSEEINETTERAGNVASLVANTRLTLATNSSLASETDEASKVTASETRGTPWNADESTISGLERRIRALVVEEGDIDAGRADKFWVRACVYARKGDVIRGAALLRSLVSWRSRLGEDTENQVPALLRRGLIWSSGRQDLAGRHVLHVRIRYADPSSFTPADVVRTMATVVEWTLRTYPAALSNGIILLGDASEIGLGNIDPRVPRELVHSFSSTLPVRVGGLCVMNPPWFMRPILAIISALLNSKLKSRIRAFGRPEELAPYFDIGSVPVDAKMGGTLHWDIETHEKWADEVAEEAKTWPAIVPLLKDEAVHRNEAEG